MDVYTLEIIAAAIVVVAVLGGVGLWLRPNKKAPPPGVVEQRIHAPVGGVEPAPKIEPPSVKLDSALANTRNALFGRLKGLFGAGGQQKQNPEIEEIEEILYTSDLGPQTVQRLLHAIDERRKSEASPTAGFDGLRKVIKDEMLAIFASQESSLDLLGENYFASRPGHPNVFMIVGVNGAGKTTTIGKLARKFALQGKKTLVAAGDTFRAAAGEQLKVWTERAQVEIFNPEGVQDPSAVAFSALEYAKAKNFDVVIVDTAGRLHTQKNLMDELKKMKRVLAKLDPTAPHETLLVLDANSGQNALGQAREFHQSIGLTGAIITKLDGTAKGGVAVGLACELNLPIRLIGVGEGMDDIRAFSAQEFVDSIL